MHHSDITINVDGTTFHAHKNILAASSGYFKTMFSSGFKESTMSEIELHLPQQNQVFATLLEFIYTGNMSKLTPDTVCVILDVACYLQVNQAVHICSAFIRHLYRKKLMSLENAEEISNRPEQELQDLVRESERYINVQQKNQSSSEPNTGRMEPYKHGEKYEEACKMHFNSGEYISKELQVFIMISQGPDTRRLVF